MKIPGALLLPTRRVPRRLNFIGIGILLAFLAGLNTGCATWSKHGVALEKEKVRLVVLPVQNTLSIKKLSYIQSLPKSEARMPTNEAERIASQMQAATENIGNCIVSNLDRSFFFQVVPVAEVPPALAALQLDNRSGNLTTNEVMALGKQLNAQAVLTVRLSGYGRIKKKWLFLLIGSGVVEGVTQGAAAAVITTSPWAGVGVAAEEILQETLTWGGGVFIFDRIFTPVVLDAQLASTADGATIWTDTTFAKINSKALKKLPEVERSRKEIRLQLTAAAAAKELSVDLNKKAFKNIRWEPEEDPGLNAAGPGETESVRTGSGQK